MKATSMFMLRNAGIGAMLIFMSSWSSKMGEGFGRFIYKQNKLCRRK